MAGQCEGHAKSAWQEERRTGKSVAVEAAHVWNAEEIVSAEAGDSGVAHVLAGARGVRAAGGGMHSADAKGADGDECAIGDSPERPERSDGDEHPPLDSGWRAGRLRLAEFRDPRVKASKETIAKSLEGTWLPEQVALLKRQLGDWDHIQRQIAACDVDLQALMKQLPSAQVKTTQPLSTADGTTVKRKRRKNGKSSKNEPAFHLEEELKRVSGVDLSRIDGIKVNTIQTLITEAGLDMSKWATEDHFVSWIGLSPRNDLSGGKLLKKKTRKVVSRLASALRIAATTLRQSESYLGAQFRRLRTKLGPPKAITAMAAKLARLVYRMLRYGQQYVDRGTALYEEKYRQQQIHHLGKKAAQHGFALVPAPKSA
jgi:transposase